MNKILALMHNTSGKTNRIRLRVEEISKDPEAKVILSKQITESGITLGDLLDDIKQQSKHLDEILDKFYVDNKHKLD